MRKLSGQEKEELTRVLQKAVQNWYFIKHGFYPNPLISTDDPFNLVLAFDGHPTDDALHFKVVIQ